MIDLDSSRNTQIETEGRRDLLFCYLVNPGGRVDPPCPPNPGGRVLPLPPKPGGRELPPNPGGETVGGRAMGRGGGGGIGCTAGR